MNTVNPNLPSKSTLPLSYQRKNHSYIIDHQVAPECNCIVIVVTSYWL